MNALTFFTLGVLSTLFLAKIMYTFIGVLRVQRKVKKLESNLNSLDEFTDKQILNLEDRLLKTIKSFEEFNDKEFLRTCEIAEKNFNLLDDRISLEVQNLYREIEELRKYIDSRIDKTLNQIQK